MGILSRLWDMVCGMVSHMLAKLFDWRAREFERGGVAAKRRELVSTVVSGGSVLEVGAGTGSTLAAGAYAGAPGRFARVVATEPDDGMRAVLTKRAREDVGSAVKVEVMDSRLPHLPFEDGEFDAVACFMVLSHVHERDEAVKEICRVLKVGGKVLLMDHGAHEHEHKHGHGHGHGQGHGHGHGGGGPFFWFREWFNFVFMRGPKDMKLEVLLDSFKKEDRLREDFMSRMMTKGFFVEICYGCFTRVR